MCIIFAIIDALAMYSLFFLARIFLGWLVGAPGASGRVARGVGSAVRRVAASSRARKPSNLHASLSPTRTTAAPARAEHAGLAAYDPAVPGPARS